MPQPGKPAPRGEDWFVRKFADLERQMQELRAANPFGLTGVTPEDGGTSFDGYMKVNGPMTVDGDADFQGNMKVSGTLDLPAGIIGNAALSSPISPLAANSYATNFGVAPGPNVEKVRATITVPSGYTRALVFAESITVLRNSTASNDDGYSGIIINGTYTGSASQITAAPSAIITLPASETTLLTDLGASFYVSSRASSAYATWASSSGNFVNLNVLVVFLR